MSYQTPIQKSGLKVGDKVKFKDTVMVFFPFKPNQELTILELGVSEALFVTNGVSREWISITQIEKV